MNNKGFTLIELLVTISVLAIVTTIGVVGVNTFSNAIREKQKESAIKRIEASASEYAFDTKSEYVLVETLINDGYLDAEDGNIIDPTTNESLNCYAVRMEKKGSYYVASFQNDKNYLSNNECNKDELFEDYGGMVISATRNTASVNTNNWIKTENVILSVKTSDNQTIDCNGDNKCIWSSDNGVYHEGSSYTFDENYNYMEYISNYTFSYKTTVDGKVKNYTSKIEIKIDNAAPMTISNGNESFYLIDGGSGVKDYCLSYDIDTCNWIPYNGEDIENPSHLEIYARDNVGNLMVGLSK